MSRHSRMTHAFSVKDAIEHGIEIAVILHNIRHWLTKNLADGHNIKNGYVWTYNTAKRLHITFPYWSEKKIQRLMKKMADDGLIIVLSLNENPFDQTRWYTLPEFFLEKDAKAPKDDVSDCNSGKDSIDHSKGQECPIESPELSDVHSPNLSNVQRTDVSNDLYQDLTQDLTQDLKKKKKDDFDPDYLETCFLVFWDSGLTKFDPVTSSECFESAWLDSNMEPLEFAEMLREDIQKRLELKQYAFERLHPSTYLKNRRWKDDYQVERGNCKVSISPEQHRIEELDRKIKSIESNRNSEQRLLELHSAGGRMKTMATESYQNNIKKMNRELEELGLQRVRLLAS